MRPVTLCRSAEPEPADGPDRSGMHAGTGSDRKRRYTAAGTAGAFTVSGFRPPAAGETSGR